MSKFAVVLLLLLPLQLLAAEDKLKVGDKFPSFELKKLGADGKLSDKQFKGKVTIVDFWASWCEPCKKELPALSAMLKRPIKGLAVVGISVDDEEAPALKFAQEHKVTAPLVHDNGKKLVELCKVSTMPTSFVLDKKGVIRFVHSGYREGDEAHFEKEVKSLLK